MRRLSKVVNIVPVIAKADTLTLEERDFFKQTVRGACVPCKGEPALSTTPENLSLHVRERDCCCGYWFLAGLLADA